MTIKTSVPSSTKMKDNEKKASGLHVRTAVKAGRVMMQDFHFTN
jgi:hypothetical protein